MKKLAIPFLIFINTLVVFLVWEYPLVMKLRQQVDKYRPVLTDEMPSIRFHEKGVELIGVLPYIAELGTGKTIRFDSVVDTTILLGYQPGSLLVTNDSLLYRGREKINRITLTGIKSDHPHTYTGPELRLKIDRYFNNIFTGILLVAAGLTLIVMLLAALIGAGCGAIVDAFSNGPFSYGKLLSIASMIQFAWILSVLVFYKFNLNVWEMLPPLLIVYLLSIMVAVYAIIRFKAENT